MGLFGKSKKEREEEQKQLAHQQNQIAKDEAYSKMLRVMEQIEKMPPEWRIGELDLYDYENGKIVAVVSAHLTEPIEVRIQLRREVSRGLITFEQFARLEVYPEERGGASIYTEDFTYGPSGKAKYNYKAWKYLNDYVEKLIEPETKRYLEGKQSKEQRMQTVKGQFWNK